MTQASTPWLTDEEQVAWRHYLRASRRLESVLDRDLAAKHGMSLAEYEILSMLSEQPDHRMRMSAMADLVIQSRSRITHTATRLEKRGWVTREVCVSDSRGRELVLTRAGLEAVVEASAVHVEGVRKYLMEAISAKQFATLGEAMRRVNAHIVETPPLV